MDILAQVIESTLIDHGYEATWVALTMLRIAVGVFFAISGYHKLFVPSRTATLRATLAELGLPDVRQLVWFVPLVELAGGVFFAAGFLTLPATVALTVLMLVACGTSGRRRVEEFKPLDACDRVDDWLYLSETLYLLVFWAILIAGPGPFSADALLFHAIYG